MRLREPTTLCASVLLVGLLVLPWLPSLGPEWSLACESTWVVLDTSVNGQPCLSAVASSVGRSGPDVTVQGVKVVSQRPCKPITDVTIVTYRDRDGREGFQQPPDELVSRISAHSDTPVDSLSVGSFSNSDPTRGRADHWWMDVGHPGGSHTRASGTFH